MSKDTQLYLSELPSSFHFISEKDNGIYDAMNKGIDLSKGKWLYFLGSGDVFYDPKVLEEIFSKSIPENTFFIAGKVYYKGITKPFIHSKYENVKSPSWSFLIWIRNSLHHQGTFYKREAFLKEKYSLKYPVLSDYWFNILLFKKGVQSHLVDTIIALCNSDGISKTGSWKTYREEVSLKIDASSYIFSLFFYSIVIVKIVIRKFVNG